MRNHAVVLLALLAASTWVHAAAPDLSKLPPPSTRTGLTFERDVQPILQASCVKCHGAVKPKEGLRLDSLQGVLKGSKHGKVVVPGESRRSQLVILAARLDPESSMPPSKGAKNSKTSGEPEPKPLTAEEIGIIRAWIDQGAK